MREDLLQGLVWIGVLGTAAQLIAWRLRVPSLLLLLTFGVLAGPVTGLLEPDTLLGPLLLPIVSLSVAVILFEGGLSLKLRELRDIGGVFLRLTLLGTLTTWLITAVAARFILDLSWPLAVLLGAILVVTGPTVIGPMLRHLRLGGQVGAILKWEGIVIDPIGAMLAVLVFSTVGVEEHYTRGIQAAAGIAMTLLVGGGIGPLAAWLLYWPFQRHWIPDHLQNPAMLATVFGVFAFCNQLQAESGLLAVTLMGIVLANQRGFSIRHIVAFKETLTVILLSILFILLSSRLQPDDLRLLDWRGLLFLAVLIVVARPAAVYVSTYGSKLSWRERIFLACMAPRGIVAAAVASVFALHMSAANHAGAERMVPITFLVVFGTVLLYGLAAPRLAYRLRLATPNPQGILFAGAHDWARAMAKALQSAGCPVRLVDSDWENISAARMEGLPIYYGSILAEHTIVEIDYGDLGRLLALTANNEVNSLACLRFAEIFGRSGVYQLPFERTRAQASEAISLEQRGRLLFGNGQTFDKLNEMYGDATIKATPLTKEFNYAAFREMHGATAVPLFLIKSKGEVTIFTVDNPPVPQPGHVLISMHAKLPEKMLA